MDLAAFCKHINNSNIKYDSDGVEKLYHYTSSTAALSILQKGKLRLTDRNFLNDYSEGRYVLQLCLDNVDGLIDDNDTLKEKFEQLVRKRLSGDDDLRRGFCTYQCSFSMKRDSLSMWNYYAKGEGIQGYCVSFTVDKSQEIGMQILKLEPEEGFESSKQKVYGGKIIYEKEKQLAIIKNLVKYFRTFEGFDVLDSDIVFRLEYLIDKIVQQGIFFKKDCFFAEEEYRLAIVQLVNDDGQFFAIKDKVNCYNKNGFFIPYVDISICPDSLSEVMISPTLDKELAKKGIKKACADKYKNLRVTMSEIPLRY